ncbi:MAG: hypothetical protein ACOCX1_05820 [Fimbriimonadaceae bacterium]
MKPLQVPTRAFAPTIELRDSDGHVLRRNDITLNRDAVYVLVRGACDADPAHVEEVFAHVKKICDNWQVDLVLGTEEPLHRGALRDEKGATRERFAGPDACAAVLLISAGGELMDGWRFESGDDLDLEEFRESVKWLATQEAECGTCHIDEHWLKSARS